MTFHLPFRVTKWLISTARTAGRAAPTVACSLAVALGFVTQAEARLAALQSAPTEQASDHTVTLPAPPRRKIYVDGTAHISSDPATFKQLCSTLRDLSGVAPAALAPGGAADAAAPSSPDWYLWAQLDSPCSTVTADPEAVQVYAVHSDYGGAVCLQNRSVHPAAYLLTIKLPGGVFRIERLSFLAQTAVLGASTDPLARRRAAELTRLAGADVASPTTISKPGELAAGEVAIVRYTDVARAARSALYEVKDQLHNLGASTPAPAARLRKIVSEGESYLSGVSCGPASTRQKRLGCVHRLILVMAQAEALHRNYQIRHTVNAAPGAKTMGALERIQDSLAETSAVMTGLVPQIKLAESAPIGSEHSGAATMQTEVTVSVRNTGLHSVESVKLGLDASALPEGAVCVPDDPAYFGELRPGQAVTAKFKLNLPVSSATDPARCVADVSYFTSGAPAHLRTRPW